MTVLIHTTRIKPTDADIEAALEQAFRAEISKEELEAMTVASAETYHADTSDYVDLTIDLWDLHGRIGERLAPAAATWGLAIAVGYETCTCIEPARVYVPGQDPSDGSRVLMVMGSPDFDSEVVDEHAVRSSWLEAFKEQLWELEMSEWDPDEDED